MTAISKERTTSIHVDLPSMVIISNPRDPQSQIVLLQPSKGTAESASFAIQPVADHVDDDFANATWEDAEWQ